VLELGPRVLQDGAQLDRRTLQGLVVRLGHTVTGDEQVPAGVTEASFAGRQAAHVAVLEDGVVLPEQLGHREDVALHIGDDAHADLVCDPLHRVGVGVALAQATRLDGEGLHGLGAALDRQVVDAGLVDDRAHGRTEVLRGLDQSGPEVAVCRDREIELAWTHERKHPAQVPSDVEVVAWEVRRGSPRPGRRDLRR
jgi:hypothetical protein